MWFFFVSPRSLLFLLFVLCWLSQWRWEEEEKGVRALTEEMIIHIHPFLFLLHLFSPNLRLFSHTCRHASSHTRHEIINLRSHVSLCLQHFSPLSYCFFFSHFFIVIYVSLLNPARLVAGITQSSHGSHYCFILSSLTSTLPSLLLFFSLFNPPSLDPSTHYFLPQHPKMRAALLS